MATTTATPEKKEIKIATAKYINTIQAGTFTTKGKIYPLETVVLPIKEGNANPSLKKV